MPTGKHVNKNEASGSFLSACFACNVRGVVNSVNVNIRSSRQTRHHHKCERGPVTLERKRNPRGKKLTACLPAASFLVINDWETKTEGARPLTYK